MPLDADAMDKSGLKARVVAGRASLDAALAAFDETAMLERIDDEWTRKDVLAHLEAWERRVVALTERLRAGDPPTDRVDTDIQNARFHARDRDRSLEDVLDGERAAYARLLTAIDEATDEELFDGSHFAWTAGDPLSDWFRSDGDEHYAEHLEQLTRPAREPYSVR